ncbi:MAG: LON peptidase substrate-binding domain-containing protein [Anaerolineae bacterium]|nr:LON peptidase substrate-binding domain-containing protein [Anaerolineae bacterium]
MTYELPLFPLNTVLFPGMPLPLHVFEERYKKMVQVCLDEKRPFGVVLIRSGVAEGGPVAYPYEIGCAADIVEVQRLEDGRLLIMAVGQERFRIVALDHTLPYLVGKVEPLPLQPEPEEAIEYYVNELTPWLLEYLVFLADMGQVEFDPAQMPENNEDLVYLASAAIQLPPEEKQVILENEKATGILQDLIAKYREEVTLLRLKPKQDQGIFSLN